MRRICSGLALAAVAACGGGGGGDPVSPTPPPPPPPSNPGAPASVSAQAGDGQAGEPGTKLATRPAVIVRDASGRAVPNVAVTFAVDSGGGSLSATAATTGADGVATAGDWTLGRSEGRNIVTARAGTLAARLVATGQYPTAQISNQTFPASGGSLVITGSGPLAGFRIDAPAGAFAGTATVRVGIATSLGIPFDTSARVASPLVTIETNATGPAEELLTIRIPARIEAGEFPMIAFVDQVTGFLDGLPTVDFDSSGVTARAGSLVPAPVIPTAGASLRAISAGEIKAQLVVLSTKLPIFTLQWNTGFLPGTDDWEFERQNTPLGSTALGQVLTAQYYYLNSKAGLGPLWNRYPEAPGVESSNSRGIYWTAGVSADAAKYAQPWIKDSEQRFTQDPVKYNQYALKFAVLSMIYSGGKPHAGGFINIQDHTVRTVLAYRWNGSSAQLFHYNPQYPGSNARYSTWTNGAPNCEPAPCLYVPGLNYLGSNLQLQWGPFQSGTLFKDRFPNTFIGRNTVQNGGPGSDDAASPDTLFLMRDTASVWAAIPSWPHQLATGLPNPSGVQRLRAYFERPPGTWTESMAGSSNHLELLQASDLQISASDAGVNLRVGLEARAVWPPLGNDDYTQWSGFKIYRLIKFLPRVEAVYAAPGTPTQFTLTTDGGPALPTNYRYNFDWGDNSGSDYTTKPATITHVYSSKEPREVTLEIVHPGSGQVVAKTSFLLGGLLVSPKPLEGEYDTDYLFTATYSGPMPPNPVYEWDLGDGRVLETPAKSLTVRYATPLGGEEKTYPITVRLKSGNSVEAVGSTSATMLDRIVAWKLTSTTLSYVFVNTQIHSDGRWVSDSTRFARINAHQSEAAVSVIERRYLSTCNEACALHEVPVGLYLWEGPEVNYATMWSPVNRNATAKETFAGAPMALPAAPLVYSWWMVRQLQTSPPPFCTNPNETFSLTGNANQGRVAGWVVHNCWGLEGGLIAGFPKITVDADVSFSGATAAGYIELTYWFYPNGGNVNAIQRKIAKLQFTAARIQ